MTTQRTGSVRKNAISAEQRPQTQEQRADILRKAAGLRWGPRKGELGLFAVTIEVAHPVERQFVVVEAVVDTGASHTVLPASLLEELGIQPIDEVTIALGERRKLMPTVMYQNNQFDTEHEATCAALFNRYEWRWERPTHPIGGWIPDFMLKGDTSVYVECKGALKWENVPQWPDLAKYEDAVSGSSFEVLLIPDVPKRIQNDKGYTASVLGFLYDGSIWSYAELGTWSGRVGFCHRANSWKDRISGDNINRSMGDGRRVDIDVDWLSATQVVRGKRVSHFKASVDSQLEEWEPKQPPR